MSRRDYVAISSVLAHWTVPMGLLGELADVLQTDNPRFDRDRFIDASLPRLPRPRTAAAVALDAEARKVAAR